MVGRPCGPVPEDTATAPTPIAPYSKQCQWASNVCMCRQRRSLSTSKLHCERTVPRLLELAHLLQELLHLGCI